LRTPTPAAAPPPPPQVPEGCTPRTMSIHIKGSITRAAKAGDVVEVAGIFLPEPLVGFKAMRAGLLASTYLEVMMVTQTKVGDAVCSVAGGSTAGCGGSTAGRTAASAAGCAQPWLSRHARATAYCMTVLLHQQCQALLVHSCHTLAP
jgi:hypothetical protein